MVNVDLLRERVKAARADRPRAHAAARRRRPPTSPTMTPPAMSEASAAK
jgi:hypothetical protein